MFATFIMARKKDKNQKSTKAQLEYSVIFVYRFLVILLIVAVFVGVVWIRASQPYDVRQLEASVVAKKSIGCLTANSVFSVEQFNEQRIKDCLAIDEKNIFLSIKFKLPNEEKNLTLGKEELFTYCQSKEEGVKGAYLPICFQEDYSVIYNDKLDKLNVFIAIDKNDKNVK